MSIEHIKAAIAQLKKAELVELADFLALRLENIELQPMMEEDRFWKIIALLDWDKQGDDAAVLHPAVNALSELSETEIQSFADWQALLLHQLDGKVYADSYAGDEENLSADGFLYARCAIVANGRETYYEILADPSQMPQDIEFEALLQLPELAWQQRTGEPTWNYVPRHNIETGFNEKGWGSLTVKL